LVDPHVIARRERVDRGRRPKGRECDPRRWRATVARDALVAIAGERRAA
jgi:hypothetical protein